jgi:hypothetical protein
MRRRIRVRRSVGTVGIGLLLATIGLAGQASGPVKVTVRDSHHVDGVVEAPVDPTIHAQPAHGGNLTWGLKVRNTRITCGENGSVWSTLRVDGQQMHSLGFGVPLPRPPQPLPPTRTGKKREGFEAVWTNNELHVTQTVEVVPSKATAGRRRLLDTCRVTVAIENTAKDGRPRRVELKTCIDILVGGNDGALYASPTTHPGKVLNGVALRGKELPEFVQVLERPNLTDPGFVATLTLKKPGKGIGPSTLVLTNLGVVSVGWEPAAQPAGDSACALLWDAQELRPGEKKEFVWAYGGGIASNPDAEGRVALLLGGSFEPHKLFTITARVDDPVPNQALTLELPEGMQRVEGRETQPVPPPVERGSSVVLWKARVLRLGEFPIRVRSSTGRTQIKTVSVQPASR